MVDIRVAVSNIGFDVVVTVAEAGGGEVTASIIIINEQYRLESFKMRHNLIYSNLPVIGVVVVVFAA